HDGDVLELGQPEQGGAEQGTAGQVEGPLGLLADAAEGRGLALVVGEVAEVLDGQGQFEVLGDDLAGDAGVGDEGGAEGLVAADDLVEGAVEGRAVERAFEPDGGGDVVAGAAGIDLVEEPEPLLGEGGGGRSVAGEGGRGGG